MKNKGPKSYNVFNKLELLGDFQPLVYFCNKGVGMFSKSVMMTLIKAEIEHNSTIMLSFNYPSFLSQTNYSTFEIVTKLDWQKNRFYFEHPELAQNLTNVNPKIGDNNIGYYCGFVNVEYSEILHDGEIIAKWNVSNIESLTREIAFYKNHVFAQKQRHEKNRDEILNLLKVGMNFYNQSLFNSAYVYLEEVLKLDPMSIKILTGSDQFWHWWKLQYYILDETIMYDYCAVKDIHLQKVTDLRSFYIEKHNSPSILLEPYLYQFVTKEKVKIRTKNKMKSELC
jgi:hypothetical protein